jgi:dipeptidyl-peptidase-4
VGTSGSLRLALSALAALSVPGLRAVASEPDAPPPAIDFDRFLADGYVGPLLDTPAWRPGHSEICFVRRRMFLGEVLVAHDVETGKERRLLRFADLDAGRARDAREIPVRGIGRSRAPRYLWAPTGDALFVPRRGDLHRVDLATGERSRLTRTRSPLSDVNVSPDGKHVSFARDFDLFAVVASADGPKELRLTTDGSDEMRNAGLDWVYPEELGCKTGSWWSPDSTRIAFLRLEQTGVLRFPIADYLPRAGRVEMQPYPMPGDRNPRPRVGVVALDGSPPVWMDVGEETDVYVPWAAWVDDARLLVPVLSRDQRRLELRLCEAATGTSRTLLVEDEPDPGWIEPPEPPLFLRGRAAFVWRRPRDGFWRPVLVEVDAERAGPGTPLTSGAFDVDEVLAVDEATGAVYYAGGGGDATRRGVYRTDLEGGAPTAVVEGPGWHDPEFDPSSRWFLDTHSSAARAARQTLRRADGSEVRPLADAETAALRALNLPAPELGRVEAGDGLSFRTRLRRPIPFDPTRRYPVVVHVYGGPQARVVRDAWTGLFDAVLASDGFAVFSLDNRGSAGCGRAFETAVCRRLGRLELEDQVRGVEDLKRLPWVDGDRVGIWGWSYGGTMACLAMTRAPEVFRAGAAVAPVTDWRLYDSIYTERYLGLPASNEAGYREGSPLFHVKGLSGALLLCHGLHDDNVHVQNTVQMADALVREGKPFDLMLYPGRGHGIEGAASRRDLYRRIREHFRRHLAPAPADGGR